MLKFIICGKSHENFSYLKSVILQNTCIPETSGIKFSYPKVSSLKFLCESGSSMECEQVNARSDNVLILLYVIFVSLVGSWSRKTFHSYPLYLISSERTLRLEEGEQQKALTLHNAHKP